MNPADFRARMDAHLARVAKLRVGARQEAQYHRVKHIAALVVAGGVMASTWPHPLTAWSCMLTFVAWLVTWFIFGLGISLWSARTIARIKAEHPMPESPPEGDDR